MAKTISWTDLIEHEQQLTTGKPNRVSAYNPFDIASDQDVKRPNACDCTIHTAGGGSKQKNSITYRFWTDGEGRDNT